MAKGLTYEELMEYAKQHYDKGGDITYECCNKQWFDDYVEMFGPMTKRKALNMFRLDDAIARDRAGY